jgi:CheY-like chemotaxis protein
MSTAALGSTAALAGRTVLLVEDEYFAMKRLRRAFEVAGATVLGPAANVPDALTLVHEGRAIDAAVLDVNLHGEVVFPVADALAERGVPFVFATGYDPDMIPARHAGAPLLRKPVDPAAVARVLFPLHPEA